MFTNFVVVKDNAHILQLASLVELFKLHKDASVGCLLLDNEECRINQAVHYCGISHDVDRHAVDDDYIVMLAGPSHKLVKAFAHQQLCGVGRYRTVVYNLQVGINAVAVNQLFE